MFSYNVAAKIAANVIFVLEPKVLYHKKLQKVDEKKADRFGFDTVKKWANYIVKIAKMDITVEGIENIPKDRPVLFTPNHQSYADIPVLIYALKDFDFGFLMRKSLNNFFAIDHISRMLKCVPIDQANARDSAKGIQQTAKQIKDGLSMVVFPEGMRTFSNTPTEFKNGAFKIAQKTGVTIVPIYMRNVHKVFEGNENVIQPAEIYVKVLEPIETSEMSRAEVKELHDKVYNIILKESEKLND